MRSDPLSSTVTLDLVDWVWLFLRAPFQGWHRLEGFRYHGPSDPVQVFDVPWCFYTTKVSEGIQRELSSLYMFYRESFSSEPKGPTEQGDGVLWPSTGLTNTRSVKKMKPLFTEVHTSRVPCLPDGEVRRYENRRLTFSIRRSYRRGYVDFLLQVREVGPTWSPSGRRRVSIRGEGVETDYVPVHRGPTGLDWVRLDWIESDSSSGKL